MSHFKPDFSSYFFPDRCLFCESETSEELSDYRLICNDCSNLFQSLSSAQLEHYHQVYMQNHFERSIIAFQFDELSQKLLHFVKYHRGIQLARHMGKLIYHYQSHQFDQYDAIIPCPLHPRKFREREFNQACEIAYGLAEQLAIPVDTQSLQRNRYTQSQTTLNKTQRLENLENAFDFVSNPSYRHILILDDVITTGATLNTIASCIKSVAPDILLTAVSFASPV
ncbi:MAG: ComF family protein [Calditrichaeota bacterium]|nr:ComF family protein [Calditrichota bacterium]